LGSILLLPAEGVFIVDIIQTILLIVQILSLIALVVYVYKTWEMASATRKSAELSEKTLFDMREGRDQETAPYVIAYFDVPYGTNTIYLIVKNIGKTMAHNIKLEFDPPVPESRHTPYLTKLFDASIPSMPPSYEIKTIFDTWEYFEAGKVLRFNIKISYSGGLIRKDRISEYIQDLSPFRSVTSSRETTLKHVVTELEKIKDKLERGERTISTVARNIEAATEAIGSLGGEHKASSESNDTDVFD
jgi:hypothetical protein